MSNQFGPRDWLSGGRHWDEIPPGADFTPAPPPRASTTAYWPAEPAPVHRHGWVWGLLALGVGCGAIAAMYAASRTPGLISPLLGFFGGALALAFGVIAWRRRRYPGTVGSIVIPMTSIAAGLFSIVIAAAVSGIPTTAQSAHAVAVGAPIPQAVASAPTPAAAPSMPTPSITAAPPTSAPASAPVPTRPPATRQSMIQTLATLQFVLKYTRGPDGLQSPALAITSAGGILDPFSATPGRILAILPANTTLDYDVSLDRRNYAVTLTDQAQPTMVARFDTVNDTVTFG